MNIFHIWRDKVFHSPIDSMNSKGKWSRNEIRYLRIGKETKEQHYYSKTLQSIFQKIKIILLEGISYFIFEIDNSNKIDKE